MRCVVALAALTVLGACGQSEPTQHEERFDFEHVERAIRYLEDPSSENLEALARTEAMEHLKRHSDRSGYYPPEASALAIARDLVSGPEARERVDQVRSLLDRVRKDRAGQEMCLSEAVRYGPPGGELEGKLFFTWGYDIGVAAGPNASLNLAHLRFLEDPAEVWYYCIHELHHTLVMTRHPMPRLADVEDTKEFLEVIRYFTFLEGTAVYAAYDARRRRGALAADPDYFALEDAAMMRAHERAYSEIYERLGASEPRPLKDDDWALLEELSNGDRLWYRAGARMAETIDRKLGREALREAVAEGPSAFFDHYRSSTAGEAKER